MDWKDWNQIIFAQSDQSDISEGTIFFVMANLAYIKIGYQLIHTVGTHCF